MYITPEMMIDLFGEQEIIEVTNLDDMSANDINLVRLNAAIEYAESEVNSYLNRPYALPLSSIPIVLVHKVADIVRWQLDSRNTRAEVRLRYEEAIKWLQLVNQGKVLLGLNEDNEQVKTTSYPNVYSQSPKPIWTRSNLSFY